MKKTLLAGLATGLLIVGLASMAHADNLILNGGFENPHQDYQTWHVYDSIEGWSKTQGMAGIEIQTSVAGSPFEGRNFVELDSNSNSGMFQNITGTAVGQSYTLSFEYSPRPGMSADTNPIQVFWNGELLSTITGTGGNDTMWSLYNYKVIGTGRDQLEFLATGRNDSLGGYLDAVSLATNPVPEPATMLLFGTGLIGLASAIRRKRS